MSSSGSIGSFGASSTQQLQQSQRGNFAARMKSDMESALKSSGVDQSKISDIMKQIQDAADKARQSGGSRDSVRSAVQDVLKAARELNTFVSEKV